MAFLQVLTNKDASFAKRRSFIPYLLLAPGLVWLFFFFIAPILTLVSTSTKTPGLGIGDFNQTYRFANYWDALVSSHSQFIRSFEYAGIATVIALLFLTSEFLSVKLHKAQRLD